ncbi:hypothetical protein HK104_009331 [Borealophlyctis nickersoniae]|nr:hypothetical protein HK104_009331 [Borealophlyctis nickersoniae]
MSLPPGICTLHGVYYQAGTLIPVSTRYGDKISLFNHTTGYTAVVDPLTGLARLESGGVYTTGVGTESERRLSKGRVNSESNLEDAKQRSSWKAATATLRLGRRTSENSLSLKTFGRLGGKSGSMGSAGSLLKGTSEFEDVVVRVWDMHLHSHLEEKVQRRLSAKSPSRTNFPDENNLSSPTMPPDSPLSPTANAFPSLLDQIRARRQTNAGGTVRIKGTDDSSPTSQDPAPRGRRPSSASSSIADLSKVQGPGGSTHNLTRRTSLGPSMNSLYDAMEDSQRHTEEDEEDDEEGKMSLSLLDFLGGPPMPRKVSLGDTASEPPTSARASVRSKRSASFVEGSEEAISSPSVAISSPSVSTRRYSLGGSGRGGAGVKSFGIAGKVTTVDSLAELPVVAETLSVDRNGAVEPKTPSITETPLIELPLENCLALPDTEQAAQNGFNIVHEAGVVHCFAVGWENMVSLHGSMFVGGIAQSSVFVVGVPGVYLA